MRLEELFENVPSDRTAKEPPQVGDLIVVTNKGGKFVAIVGQIDKSTARIYDYASRRQMGSVILKYLNKMRDQSKHSRKELARRLGFQSNDSSLADKFLYKDISRVEHKNKRYYF